MIRSELNFFVFLLKWLVLLPFNVLLILFGKRSTKDITSPAHEIVRFVREAKITWYLIVINIVFFILEVLQIPFITSTLEQISAQSVTLQTLLLSFFLHASIAHLLGNMFFLFIFGRIVERNTRAQQYIMYYVLIGLLSSYIGTLIGQHGIGASGVVSGIIALAILYEPLYLSFLAFGIPLPIMLIAVLALLSDLIGLTFNVDAQIGYAVHLAGYITAQILAFLIDKKVRERMLTRILISVATLLSVAVLYLGYLFLR